VSGGKNAHLKLDPDDITKAILIRAPSKLWEAMDAEAKRMGLTRSEAVRRALGYWIMGHMVNSARGT